jgi:hypothetical protein
LFKSDSGKFRRLVGVIGLETLCLGGRDDFALQVHIGRFRLALHRAILTACGMAPLSHVKKPLQIAARCKRTIEVPNRAACAR